MKTKAELVEIIKACHSANREAVQEDVPPRCVMEPENPCNPWECSAHTGLKWAYGFDYWTARREAGK